MPSNVPFCSLRPSCSSCVSSKPVYLWLLDYEFFQMFHLCHVLILPLTCCCMRHDTTVVIVAKYIWSQFGYVRIKWTGWYKPSLGSIKNLRSIFCTFRCCFVFSLVVTINRCKHHKNFIGSLVSSHISSASCKEILIWLDSWRSLIICVF